MMIKLVWRRTKHNIIQNSNYIFNNYSNFKKEGIRLKTICGPLSSTHGGDCCSSFPMAHFRSGDHLISDHRLPSSRKVSDCTRAPEHQRSSVVRRRSFLRRVEGSEPKPFSLIWVSNLRSPLAPWSLPDADEPLPAVRARFRLQLGSFGQLRTTGARRRRRSRGRRRDLEGDLSDATLHRRHDAVLVVVAGGVGCVGVGVYDPHKLWLDSRVSGWVWGFSDHGFG
ncbi:hypothetical protein C1H46_033810 [Malus baccata]|uniref:Uncharacterized protein n=1 Tax=Malus baccata TaxID=106549 RepID=A0A540L2C3_MALBA|nr:hypothetical protein C1H46_033810 [Malus baccata]